MFEAWYAIVALMLTLYVVLDGFDLGAGALHLVVARTEPERRAVLAAIGPFWDANEVWLIAAGGALFVAFPRALAVGLSGFYLAIFMVLWCLILRALSIEFRHHLPDPLWKAFWDLVLPVSSSLLAILFGAALGNIVRGLPLGPDGWFQLTLFTSFRPALPVGILDWYTVFAGVFALLALAGHGAAFLAWKTVGEVGERSRKLSLWLLGVVAALWPILTWATNSVNPTLFAQIAHRPLVWAAIALALLGLLAALALGVRRASLAAFLGSSAFLAGMLGGTAACLFPVLLRSIPDPASSLTAWNSGQTDGGLRTALGWWGLGFPIALAYFFILFRIHRGKLAVAEY